MSKSIKVRKNNSSAEFNLIKTLLISIFAGLLSFVALLAFFSVIIMTVYIEKNYLFLFVLICSGISTFISAIFVCKFSSHKKLLFSLVAAISLSVIEFLLILCFNNAALSNLVYLLFPITIVFGFIGCVAGMNIRKR